MENYDYTVHEENIKVEDLMDFPFGDVSNLRWLISLAILFGGFILSLGRVIKSVPILVTVLILSSIGSLIVLDLHFFRKLFKRIRAKDLLIMLFTLVLTFIFAVLSANFLKQSNLVENPISEFLSNDNIKILFAVSLVQLLIEEIVFVLPFLFIYHNIKKINRYFAIALAWIISSEIFGALHLSTYSYNFLQCLVIISSVRFGLTTAYVWRKNLALTYIVHVVYDWILLFIVLYAKNSGLM
ncbi:CPBP family intramembrane glutamic endopeptidase [Peptoniphilus mikwangii]|uniref:CPBP family intramembrane glutamic endopeptidase n=1 Tax=Peptoniphilus mikwangii TaxID=1354300 RepID=UPI0004046989|nr:CPBP family intramembrane glutamic endopeptidase [Peptoniphilus mikwangii]